MFQQLDENGHPIRQFAPVPQIPEPPAVENPYQQPQQNMQNILSGIPQTSQVPAPTQQIPNFSPVPEMPAQTAQAQIHPLNREDPQYQNGRLRNVLNAIAGGLAGAAGGPEAGIKVGSSLRDMKFNRAQDAQNRRMALLKPQVVSEEKRT